MGGESALPAGAQLGLQQTFIAAVDPSQRLHPCVRKHVPPEADADIGPPPLIRTAEQLEIEYPAGHGAGAAFVLTEFVHGFG